MHAGIWRRGSTWVDPGLRAILSWGVRLRVASMGVPPYIFPDKSRKRSPLGTYGYRSVRTSKKMAGTGVELGLRAIVSWGVGLDWASMVLIQYLLVLDLSQIGRLGLSVDRNGVVARCGRVHR